MTLAQTSKVSVDTTFYIYLLIGQSNMAGRGKLTDEYKSISDSRVLTLSKEREWVTAKHPLHFDKPVAAVGPGLSFGIAMADANPGKKIGLIPCAVGGTSINKWISGAFDPSTNTHPWDDAQLRIQEGMKYGIIKGAIWHQGESDSNADSSKIYLQRLTELIDRVRDEVQSENLPFVAGELGRYKPEYHFINDVIRSLPEKVKHTGLVSSEGLEHNGDGVHFDSEAAVELGKRYAKAMLDLSK